MNRITRNLLRVDRPLLESRVLLAGASPTAGAIAGDSPTDDSISSSALTENDNAQPGAAPTIEYNDDGQREGEAVGSEQAVAEAESPAREFTMIEPEDRVANLVELEPVGPVEGDRSKPIVTASVHSGQDVSNQRGLNRFLGKTIPEFVYNNGSLFATVVPERFPDDFSIDAVNARRFESANLGLEIASAELGEGQTISPLRALQNANNSLARSLEFANGVSFVNNAIVEEADGPVTLYVNLPDERIDGLPDDRSSPDREPTVFTFEEILNGTWSAQDFRDGDQLVIPAAIVNRARKLEERSLERNVETGSLFRTDGSPIATPELAAGTAEFGNLEGVDRRRDENGEIIDSIDEEGVIFGNFGGILLNNSIFFLDDEDIGQVGATMHTHPSRVIIYAENQGTFGIASSQYNLPTAQREQLSTAADTPETSSDPASVASADGEPESGQADVPVKRQGDRPSGTRTRQRGDRVRAEREGRD